MLPSLTRRTLLAMTAASCVALSGTSTFAAEPAMTPAQADAKLTEIVNGWGNPDKALAGLAAIRIKNGDIAYEYHSGTLDGLTPDGVVAADENALYRVASISKMVFAIGVMDLVESGKLDLDADVSDYLGFSLRNPHFPETPITARMLLAHTSSLRDGSVYSIPLPHKLDAFFTEGGAFYEDGAHFATPEETHGLKPGDYFKYTNLNFGVLATVVERITGERFDHFMRDNVLMPLGIDASYNPRTLSDDAFANLVPLYRPVDGAWVAQVDDYIGKRPDDVLRVENPDGDDTQDVAEIPLSTYEIGTNGTLFSPQGGLRISAHDLARIGQFFLKGGELDGVRLLKPDTVKLMQKPVWTFDGNNGHTYWGLMQEYGLSVQNLLGNATDEGSDITWQGYTGGLSGHAGEAYGLLSGLYFDTETGDGYVYILQGTPNLDDNYGSYSSFFNWEEGILTTLSGL
ncbi:serine hydrolase domain-containing protein [Shimia haliotis]|uniref:CubicO group peptidase, beta-lactamase class C family n=1 Tax=Shimia haliotis TaxID=1280847 RepID=A0A1I4A8E9_9RHOB|nr:serine hydrolase [Shimia haliotis]SFK52593.1 CubicO group peptidase, beta-lactamase class C family [Shimia haliotis]